MSLLVVCLQFFDISTVNMRRFIFLLTVTDNSAQQTIWNTRNRKKTNESSINQKKNERA